MRIPSSGDPFAQLPPELSIGVLKHLDDADLDKCMQVSRGWRDLVDTEAVWRSRLQRLVGPAWRGLPAPDGYKALHKLARNVAPLEVSLQETLTLGHAGAERLWTCGRSLVVGSVGRIQTYDVHTREMRDDWPIDGHPLYADEDIVVSGEFGPLVVWNARTHESLHVFDTWAFGSPRVCRVDKHIIVGNGSGGVSVWDIAQGTLVRQWKTADFSAMGLAVDKDLLAVHDGVNIRFWNWRTGERLTTLGEEDLYVPTRCRHTLLMRSNVFIALSNWHLRAWDLTSGSEIAGLQVPYPAHRYGLNHPRWVGDTVACLGDGGIVFWDFARKKYVTHRFPETDNFVGMEIIGDNLFALTADGHVQVWKFSSRSPSQTPPA